MFIVTGTFNGTSYDQSKPGTIKVQEIAERFGLKLPTPKKAVMISYKEPEGKVDQFGQRRMPRSIGTAPIISGYDPETGDSVTIQLKLPRLNPKSRLSITGGVKSFGPGEAELAVFWQLYPGTIGSPFHVPGQPAYLKVYDPEIQYKAAADQSRTVSALNNRIIQNEKDGGIPWEDLKVIALGMNVAGHTFSDVVNQGENPTRFRMSNILLQNPVAFLREWRDPKVSTAGLVRWALDEQLIQWQASANGSGWHWRSDIKNGRRICLVRADEDGITVLISAAEEDDTILTFIKEFRGRTVMNAAQVIENEEFVTELTERKTMSPEERTAAMLRAAATAGTIEYDQATLEIWKIKDGARVEKYADLDADKIQNTTGDWATVAAESLNYSMLKSIRMYTEQAKHKATKKPK